TAVWNEQLQFRQLEQGRLRAIHLELLTRPSRDNITMESIAMVKSGQKDDALRTRSRAIRNIIV
ncbi:MAG: hypothetical protein K8F91_20725, partial [Candidatus Obscuribacterales bacterium]|nr:hypothetical protein [Candidatus Obscuribacterales bacterium]